MNGPEQSNSKDQGPENLRQRIAAALAERIPGADKEPIDPNALEEEDLRAFESVFSAKDDEQYENKVWDDFIAYHSAASRSVNSHRKNFAAYLANQMSKRIL